MATVTGGTAASTTLIGVLVQVSGTVTGPAGPSVRSRGGFAGTRIPSLRRGVIKGYRSTVLT